MAAVRPAAADHATHAIARLLFLDLTKQESPNPFSKPRQVSEDDQRRLKTLRRQLEEARDMANPRFVVLCDIDAPWDWTFVLLRSYARLRSALHRLYPQAPQLLADRRLNPR